MSNEEFADVIAFPVNNIEKYSDQEVLSLYFSSLMHPKVIKQPYELAKVIIDYAGKGEKESSDQNVAFQSRVHAINMGTATPSNQEWDELTDPSSENYDVGFSEVVIALQNLKGEESIVRDALFVLMDIRVSSIRLKMYDDADFKHIVAFLTAKPDARVNGRQTERIRRI